MDCALLGVWLPRESFVQVSRVGWVDNEFDTFVFAGGTVEGRKKVVLKRDSCG